jgi:hypothetical protein
MEYAFDLDHAKKYGVNEAIMLKNFIFWISKHRADDTKKIHYHEGRWWVYNTRKFYATMFYFWSEDQVYRIIQSLLKQKVLIKHKKGFNKFRYDRTGWYALTDERLLIQDKKFLLYKIRKKNTREIA